MVESDLARALRELALLSVFPARAAGFGVGDAYDIHFVGYKKAKRPEESRAFLGG